jgi:hypothetical protein
MRIFKSGISGSVWGSITLARPLNIILDVLLATMMTVRLTVHFHNDAFRRNAPNEKKMFQMMLDLLSFLSDVRKPYIDHYLRNKGIELTTFSSSHPTFAPESTDGYQRVVHLRLVAYLKQCISNEDVA